MRNFFDCWYFIKFLVPFLIKLFLGHELILIDASIELESWTISSNSDFLIDFSKLPFEFFLIKLGMKLGNAVNKVFTDFFELLFVFFTIEFKRIVHDITVVESSNCNIVLKSRSGDFIDDVVDISLHCD